ncbi:hypothetical protein BELL_0535g00050 [Botrytis elliptica]|uniref:Uncharacterized protein n=1 Tax=Botrytis elliptica TaxID=278938 RepID=A0A4Z1JJT9_9HELO|nr:hypothetical protein BELL_0535g00050 [Botrytis elliptica]
MKLPMANHLNGLRRMGLDQEQCESTNTCAAYRVAEWTGVKAQKSKDVRYGLIGTGRFRDSVKAVAAILLSSIFKDSTLLGYTHYRTKRNQTVTLHSIPEM